MAGLLDYIEAPIHAIGGLFGGGGSAPAPAAQPVAQTAYDPSQGAAPAAVSPQGAALTGPALFTPPVAPVHSRLANWFDDTFARGSQRETDAQQQRHDMIQYQGQRLNNIYQALPDDQKPAFLMNPQGYMDAIDKGIGPQAVKDTERLIRPALAGGNVDAQHLGQTVQGATYTQGQSGPTMNTGGPGSVITAPATDSVTQYTPPTSPGLGPQGGPPPAAPMIGGAAPPAPVPGAPVAAPGQQSGVPRGIRNNNPGNVKALPNGQMWNGQTGVDEMGHAIFANPTDGVHATLTNLQTYANKHGINTVAGIAQRWKGDGDASGYAQYLAKQVGVKPGDKIDLNDPAVLGKVAQGIFQFENGPKAMQTRFPGVAGQPPQIGQAAPAQASAGSSVKTLIPGRTARPATEAELVAAGYGKGTQGVWGADGKLEITQKPDQIGNYSKDDQKRVADLRKEADAANRVGQMATDFMVLNKKNATGPGYADLDIPVPFAHHEINVNPTHFIASGVNGDLRAMESLTSRAAPLLRPEGSGRIMGQEYGNFLQAFPNTKNLGTANEKITGQLQSEAQTRRAYADFMANYLQQHGSLTGADESWGKVKKASTPASSAGPASSPPQKQRILTYNPKTGGLE